jgi:mono/diheme cytochrome c family protein
MRLLLLGFVATCIASAQVDFVRDIQPIFAKRCSGCHGPQQQMNGLRLDEREAAMKGGASGPVIIPGDSGRSKLIVRVSSAKKGFAMPPAGAPLTAAEVKNLREWIDEGAKWPVAAKSSASGSALPTHWSFVPVERPALPDVRDRAWVRNPIDAFVLARLESEAIGPAPEADRRTLLRRLSFDLTGLPPSPREIDAFLADNRPDAYERAVDRLMASPHYGEKWARQWLDLAHYADSDGYEKDRTRPWAWRYRQWVIEALNRDMPFDEFTIDQLAGDLLPGARVDQIAGTGFLRNTLTNREAGVDRMEARFEQIVNRTNTVATTWLGLTMGCGQCHNHKFDPISQKDYYSMFAFFENAEEQNIDAPLPGELGPYFTALPGYRAKREEILAQYKIRELAGKWETRLRQAYVEQGKDLEWDFAVTGFRAGFDRADRALNEDRSKRTQREQNRIIDYFLENIGPDFGKDKALADSLKEARKKLNDLAAKLPQYSQAPVMETDPSIPATRLHIGGDYKNTGDVLQPNTPAVLPPLEGQQHDRLALARWLVSPRNPLTARVTVNRIWQELFGTGLVRTSEDFGTQGETPSHPQLLDWLASEFMDRGWSMKQMVRLLVTSATYRQSSNTRKELEARDPENRLLARQSRLRLPAELVRDAALASAGLLNPEIGGKSVRPAQPAGVAELGYANSVKWMESTGMDRYRRGLYIHYQRTTPYPLLSNFDAPDSNTTCSRRRRSNTPLQALNLLNDPVFFEAAEALAVRVLNEAPAGDLPQRLDYAFELCLGRAPKSSERDRLASYFEAEKAAYRADAKAADAMLPAVLEHVPSEEGAAWVAVARVLLNLDEFITRE